MVLLDFLLEMPARGKRSRKTYMTIYISPELKHAIDKLRGPVNRSVFVELLLWHGLRVLKRRIGDVLTREKNLIELVSRSRKKPHLNSG